MGQVQLPPVAGITYRREVFLASSTFTLPLTAFDKFDCILVSGGGGGARGGNNQAQSFGGQGTVAYFKDIFCTKGTTLTITVGAGGTGASSNYSRGNQGNASTITGLAGNGISTSISSGDANGGFCGAQRTAGGISPQVGFRTAFNTNGGQSTADNMSQGFGLGVSALSSGNASVAPSSRSNIFGSNLNLYGRTGPGQTVSVIKGGTGGPVPLLSTMLHAAVGSDGTTTSFGPGGLTAANTYFAGAGGSANYGNTPTTGVGGGGGCGGKSTNSGVQAGTGGNASVNSGGGGGGGGINTVAPYNNGGNGGIGGSGFVIIGYWS